ncbi:MAG: tyrosine-type recombinase/integrase [Gemmatimonadaceae bacterium]
MAAGSVQKIMRDYGASYRVRVEFPLDPLTGKRRQRSKVVKTKKEADRLLAEWLVEIERGIAVDGAKMTVGEYLKYWLETYVKHNTRATTYRGYEVCVRVHLKPVLGSIPLQKLTAAHLQAYYQKAIQQAPANGRKGTLSPRTVRLTHSVIREALQHALEWNMVARNVADATKPPRAVRPKVEVWNAEEAQRFLAVAENDGYSPIWLVALTTGMRQGELCALRWEDIDFKRGVLHIRHTLMTVKGEQALREPKTRSGRRTITLSPVCLAALADHRDRQRFQRTNADEWHDRDAVFSASNGEWTDHGNLTRSYNALVRRADVKRIPFHGLRHTHATLLLKEGVNVKVVSERLGHANISITLDTYAHVLPSMQQQAADGIDAALFG